MACKIRLREKTKTASLTYSTPSANIRIKEAVICAIEKAKEISGLNTGLPYNLPFNL